MTIRIIETDEKVRGTLDVFELDYQNKDKSEKYYIKNAAGVIVKTITAKLSRIVKGRALLGINISESEKFTVKDVRKQDEKLCVHTASGDFFLEPA
jgi:putative methionine-R-sulfoxide reductase with GAF domain